MIGVYDAVDDGVPQVEVGSGHVDLGPQGMVAFLELSVAHAIEEVEVFLRGALSKRAVFSG